MKLLSAMRTHLRIPNISPNSNSVLSDENKVGIDCLIELNYLDTLRSLQPFNYIDTLIIKKFIRSLSRRQMSTEDPIRSIILSTPLPATIVRRIKGRSRIAVKTVGDLQLHITIINELFRRYPDYCGELINCFFIYLFMSYHFFT